MSDDAKVVSGTIAASFSTLVASLVLLFSETGFGTLYVAALIPPLLFLWSWYALTDEPLIDRDRPEVPE
ncbi:MAG: hypothetical protein ABEI57_07660 [Halapricum sp.]